MKKQRLIKNNLIGITAFSTLIVICAYLEDPKISTYVMNRIFKTTLLLLSIKLMNFKPVKKNHGLQEAKISKSKKLKYFKSCFFD